MARLTGPTAALAGTPVGVQGHGVWAGRRQLVVRFAGEAETAVMYTAEALAQELKRLLAKTTFHSLAVSGRDTLGHAEYLAAVFAAWEPTLPVLLDTDGQRPEAVRDLRRWLRMLQVTLAADAGAALVERALHTLREAAGADLEHALVLDVTEQTSDGQLLRIVEQAHEASERVAVIVHPSAQAEAAGLDRRWSVLLEQATSRHADVRLVRRIPPPLGLR
ncbi:MAG TPA: hypothetical protein VFZ11_11480 [Gemmatimonadaceae bacterium]